MGGCSVWARSGASLADKHACLILIGIWGGAFGQARKCKNAGGRRSGWVTSENGQAVAVNSQKECFEAT